MDRRTELRPGDQLSFPGMECTIVKTIGCGSNAIVYEGEYQDATSRQRSHRVLIKELFPYEPGGHIWRDERQCICRDAQGEEVWALHRNSFERGNSIHLQLLAQFPDQTGGNLNTFALNETLYTLLDYSGGRSMERELGGNAPLSLILQRMRKLLLSLSVLHGQGYLHLDISPDNVLFIGQGELERVLLIDYNSMHSRDELAALQGVSFSTKEGYTAPEVCTGMLGSIGPCTDLFSVGCLLYTMLMGEPPTAAQLSRKNPPDAADSPLLQGVPATVRAQLSTILRRSLCVLPHRRYQSCAAMLRDLEELERRIAGVGVTHAALWEAGRKGVQHLIRRNPSLSYVEHERGLYPLRIQPAGGASMPAREWMHACCGEDGASFLLLGEGGMGKSTALLRAALAGASRYTPARPAVMYLPLMGIKRGERNYILDHILMELHFDAKTRTMEDARHALVALLNAEGGQEHGAPVRLLLLLDGLNEAGGDTSGLLEEIRRLSAYGALRMVIATRAVPEELALPQAAMVPLEEGDVAAALGENGLLLPEREDMRRLLRTPMMLSLFIRTAKDTGAQVLCQSEQELIDGYLDALCRKAATDGGCAVDYRVEAAVRLVLPAIAREIHRQGRPLDDRALYRVVGRCHRVLRGRALSRAFPEWIGHSREVLGDGAQTAEVWHGEIVQRILWQKLGLLVRGEDGCYHILHQLLEERLIAQAVENDRRIRARRARAGLLAAVSVALLTCAGLLVYDIWIKPQPYNERMSVAVTDAAFMQYVRCGLQYEAMTEMLSGRMEPENCAQQVAQLGETVTRTAQLAMGAMTASEAEVIPWSEKALDFDSVGALMLLPAERQAEYERYIRACQLIRSNGTGARTTQAEFADALRALLEADADVAWLLHQMAVMPHVETMRGAQRETYDVGMLSLPKAQRDRNVDTSLGLASALKRAQEDRRKAMDAINSLAVMHDPALAASDSAASAQAQLLTQEDADRIAGMYAAARAGTDGAVDVLIAQLDAYLACHEQLFAIQEEAYACAEDFCQRQDYGRLCNLRIASDRSQMMIWKLTAPTLSLGDEELLALMLLGVETDAIETEVEALPSVMNGALTSMILLEAKIDGALLSGEELDSLRRTAQIDRQAMELKMRYVCDMVNYLLLPVADSAQTGAFWEAIPQRYPMLGSVRAAWESDGDVLIERYIQLDSDYTALISQSAELLGMDSYLTDQAVNSVRRGETNALTADALVIDGMPTLLPLPEDWLYPEDSYIYTSEEDVGGIPKTLMLWDPGVSLEAFEQYVQTLMDFGATVCKKEGSDEDGWKYTLVYEQRELMLTWSPLDGADVTYAPEHISLETLAYLRSRR